MTLEKILFTSESVSEGHPDKLCDQISDAVLDACLENDPNSRVACEVFATGNFIVVGGEITTKSPINIEKIVKDVLKSVGYDRDELGTNYHNVEIVNRIKQQSPDIAMGVNNANVEEIGAGDQGIMFGFATKETDGYMPIAIVVAHKLVREATKLRKSGAFLWARPDMKSQVTIDYTDPNNIRIQNILMSVQHEPDYDEHIFKEYIHKDIMQRVARSFGLNDDFDYEINPTGSFVIGGPLGDTGLTGRKIIVDTYGGYAPHGGGAFSGKDPTKVDRSATYMARYIAKNLVAADVCDKALVQLSYAIGIPEPLSINVETFGTAKVDIEDILCCVRDLFDCRPGVIIENFSLNKPSFKYRDLTNYGHFGRPDLDLPWERLDMVEYIKDYLFRK